MDKDNDSCGELSESGELVKQRSVENTEEHELIKNVSLASSSSNDQKLSLDSGKPCRLITAEPSAKRKCSALKWLPNETAAKLDDDHSVTHCSSYWRIFIGEAISRKRLLSRRLSRRLFIAFGSRSMAIRCH